MNAPDERPAMAPLLLVLLLAAATRLSGLAEGFWIDEVISADTAAMPLGELLARTGLADVHPPGYYLALKLWTSIAGPSDLAARLLTLTLSVGTVALVYLYGSARLGRLPGLLAALILALYPVHVHYGVEVRSYTLLAGLTLGALWCHERLMELPSCRTRRLLFVVTLSALPWTHTLGLLLAGLLIAHGLLTVAGPALSTLRALSGCVAALFTPWFPLLLVQVLHQPEGMTAHLATPVVLGDLATALGPAGLSEIPMAPAILGLGVWITAAVLWLRVPRRAAPKTHEVSTRGWWVASAVLGLTGPLLALTLLPLSELTFDLIAGEIGTAYGLFGLSVAGIWGLSLLPRVRSATPGAPGVLLVGYLALVLLIQIERPIVNLRNLLPVLPLVALGASLGVRGRPRAAMTVAVLWIALSSPSLGALVDRAEDGPIPARDDLRGAALLVDDPGATVVVIPQWDAPGISRYLDPDREVIGALDPAGLQLGAAERLSVVLTRSAAADPEPFLQAIEGGRAHAIKRGERRRLRGAPAVEVVRYTPTEREQDERE